MVIIVKTLQASFKMFLLKYLFWFEIWAGARQNLGWSASSLGAKVILVIFFILQLILHFTL